MYGDSRSADSFCRGSRTKPIFLLQKILHNNKLEFVLGSFKQHFLNGDYSAVFQMEDKDTKMRYNAGLRIFKIKKQINGKEEDVWRHIYEGPLRENGQINGKTHLEADVIDEEIIEYYPDTNNVKDCNIRREIYRKEGTPDWFLS
jgi:hypothetical protein